eukprot:2851209-Pleurochrysis_carterae.AAC.1
MPRKGEQPPANIRQIPARWRRQGSLTNRSSAKMYVVTLANQLHQGTRCSRPLGAGCGPGIRATRFDIARSAGGNT